MSLDLDFFKKIKISVFQIVLASIAIVCLFLTVPQIINIQKASVEVSGKKKILKELENKIKNFSLLEQDEAAQTKAYNDFLASLPAQKEFPIFLELISQLAKDNNVKIIAMEPQKITDIQTSFFVKIPVFIDAYCGYHELGRFINDIEFADKFMKIGTIKITKDDQDSDKIQVFLLIYAFCLIEENSV